MVNIIMGSKNTEFNLQMTDWQKAKNNKKSYALKITFRRHFPALSKIGK
ncbi:hypothetical protein SAMN04488101_102410 [Pedobacter nyackensis]|uniref:Uncharacterized protein n=1 Tax=Pedobacter nyackensis TaxID=475255 RepID=A0A1W2BEK0_9SPHI|nr:hypothetical protein SAMN04488101_102410 [Pedobacter nyackensis]